MWGIQNSGFGGVVKILQSFEGQSLWIWLMVLLWFLRTGSAGQSGFLCTITTVLLVGVLTLEQLLLSKRSDLPVG